MTNIDQSSAIPIYHQIALDLRRRIEGRDWRIGEKLPTEPELAREYGVSRMTIRQAMSGLVKDNILLRRRGYGTFIHKNTAPFVHTLSFPVSFALRLRELGLSPSTRVLQAEVIEVPNGEVAEKLHIPEKDRVTYFRRIMLVNELPMAINRSYLPVRLCPGITDMGLIDNSIAITLEKRHNLRPVHTEHWLEIERASRKDAPLLKIEPDEPLLLLTTLSTLKDGTPLEYSRTSWVGNRIRLHVRVDVPQDLAVGSDRA